MPSPYQEFARKARERFEKKRNAMALGKGGYRFTLHAQHKMRQYGLSEQRVRSVIRSPKRREEGIVPRTVAVMQPVSMKKVDGREVWKQEIWVMYQLRRCGANSKFQIPNSKQNSNSKFQIPNSAKQQLRIISAWRYPGVSPKRNPIPDEILRELEDGSILEMVEET
ncbi:MAG: hypothetical protein WAW00_01040 [Candidatus Moraniibacteriota bacterium]